MAPYSSIKNLLTRHGEKNSEVQRCVFVSLGVAVLESDKYHPGSPKDESAFVERLMPELAKAIAAHPNVSAPVTIAETGPRAMTMTSPEFLAIGTRYLFHFTLPKPQQKYASWSTSNDIEDFYAIYSGSLFAVFREILDYPERCWIGQEFREVLHTQIPKETSAKSPPLGPTPLRLDVYLVVRRSDSGVERSAPKAFMESHDLFVVFDETETKTDKLVDEFYMGIEYKLLAFYGNALARRKADDLARASLGLFTDLADTAQRIFANPAWRLIESRRLYRRARTQLSLIHKNIVESETRMLGFERERESFLRGVSEHPILCEARDYFQRELGDEADVPKSLTPALGYFESQLSLYLNIHTLLVSAVVGAVMGAVLGSLITWGLGRLDRPSAAQPQSTHALQLQSSQ